MPEPPTPTLIPTAAEPESTPKKRRFSRNDNGNGKPPKPPRPAKPKLKKLRLAFVLLGLGALAVISTVFGMLMAVASDLPSLENKAEYQAAQNSRLYFDDPDNGACKDFQDGCQLAKLTGNQNRVLLSEDQISPFIENAVIAIEDRRFYEHSGVDYTGIGRALAQDVLKQRAAQGGSTITQQFVKNALAAQSDRSVFQKLREAALAYHLERKWTKQKILTQYLNTVYFGNGAYGVESAMRTYFGAGDNAQDASVTGTEPEDDSQPAAQNASPEEAALLAGMIASPTMFDPVQNPRNATMRRNLVLHNMYDQHMLSRSEYLDARRKAIPSEEQISPPRPESDQPYFSSWVTQQLVDRYKPGRVFAGGLKIKTTIDPALQADAEQAISGRIGGIGPAASMAVIENKTGEIKAMVGGDDFDTRPFNLAVNGHRQPGSSIKPFILVRALADGVSPDATFTSEPKSFPVPGSKTEHFNVANYEDSYSGIASLRSALATSDNSVFAELGLKEGTKRVARMARLMGVRTKVSTNPAMTLGGLEEGVTPLEMAYAYSTIANKGVRVSGTLAPDKDGPVAIERVEGSHGLDDKNEPIRHRVFSEQVGQTAQELMGGVVSNGTGKAAAVGDEFIFGKTGTTENYGDAWFVGSNEDLTVAVWVGYPDRLQPMKTEYLGGPVAGGTFPAEIFHDFMVSWLTLRADREARKPGGDDEDQSTVPSEGYAPSESAVPQQGGTAPAPTEEPDQEGGAQAPEQKAPAQEQTPAPTPAPETPPTPAPAPTPTPTPAPPATPAPSGGTGGGANAGGTP
jgi:penicillin-binding protein 1A